MLSSGGAPEPRIQAGHATHSCFASPIRNLPPTRAAAQRPQNLLCRHWNHGTRPVNACHSRIVKKLVVLRRNDAAHHHKNVFRGPSCAVRQSIAEPVSCGLRPARTRRRRAHRFRLRAAPLRGESGTEGPISTSKPMSANAVAITFAPRSWPSWPILATRMRGRRPSAFSNSTTISTAFLNSSAWPLSAE